MPIYLCPSPADPQFIKATIVHQDQAYDDKIYYFFREDNPDKNPEAPLNVSRVAQLCRVSRRLSGQVCLCLNMMSELCEFLCANVYVCLCEGVCIPLRVGMSVCLYESVFTHV